LSWKNSLYRVEISNRGAVVEELQLKNYKDDAKPQRVLDVRAPDASQQIARRLALFRGAR